MLTRYIEFRVTEQDAKALFVALQKLENTVTLHETENNKNRLLPVIEKYIKILDDKLFISYGLMRKSMTGKSFRTK